MLTDTHQSHADELLNLFLQAIDAINIETVCVNMTTLKHNISKIYVVPIDEGRLLRPVNGIIQVIKT